MEEGVLRKNGLLEYNSYLFEQQKEKNAPIFNLELSLSTVLNKQYIFPSSAINGTRPIAVFGLVILPSIFHSRLTFERNSFKITFILRRLIGSRMHAYGRRTDDGLQTKAVKIRPIVLP